MAVGLPYTPCSGSVQTAPRCSVQKAGCNGLDFLGIVLDEIKNKNNEAVISTDKSKVTVHVMQTNDQLMIANMDCKVLGYPIKN